jgi:hypothetical protein
VKGREGKRDRERQSISGWLYFRVLIKKAGLTVEFT